MHYNKIFGKINEFNVNFRFHLTIIQNYNVSVSPEFPLNKTRTIVTTSFAGKVKLKFVTVSKLIKFCCLLTPRSKLTRYYYRNDRLYSVMTKHLSVSMRKMRCL